MSTESPLIYVILGAAGSGRREVIADLIDGGLQEGERAAVLLAPSEKPGDHDARLGEIVRWAWVDGRIEAQIPAGVSQVFFVTDGRANPVDQIEALKPWIGTSGGELGRVLTVVNCKLAEQHPALVAWYEACIHFSDIVLLHQREGVANKWMSDFQGRFKEKLYFPALFEIVKAGRVKNPFVILEPQARRMSHYFDIDEWTGIDLEGVEIGEEDDDDFDDEGKPTAKNGKKDAAKKPAKANAKDKGKANDLNDDDDWKPEVDPYFVRRAGGQREREIPDIAKFL